MRRVTLAVALALTAFSLYTARPVPPARGARAVITSSGPKALGVASCAAMACHHGNSLPGSKGSEYSTWVALDPHARAYRVLFDDRSVRMQALLDPKVKAHENPLCLKCHSSEAVGAGRREFRGDGVGCESCD